MVIGDSTATPLQPADAITNIGIDGISMSGTTTTVINNVKIARTGRHGIGGTDVTNLTITDSEILNAGDGNEENGVSFGDVNLNTNNLDGTVTVTNTIIVAYSEAGWFTENWFGTLNITFNNVTIGRNANTFAGGNTFGEQGIELRADATSNTPPTRATINATVMNSFFDDVDGNAIFVTAEGLGGSADININTTRIENATALGIVLFGGDTVGNPATLTFDITNNNSGDDGLFNIKSTAISIQPNGSSTMSGTVSNTIVNGSMIGRGIEVLTDDDANANVAITNNTVSNTAFNGIFAANQNTANLNIDIKNNNVSAPLDTTPPSGLAVHGIEVNVRETSVNCLDIDDNVSAGNAASSGAAYRTRQRDNSVFNLEGFMGLVLALPMFKTSSLRAIHLVMQALPSQLRTATVPVQRRPQ